MSTEPTTADHAGGSADKPSGASSAGSVRKDPRRRIPRTDALLALPEAQAIGPIVAKRIITSVQQRARSGEISPDEVEPAVRSLLTGHRGSLRPVINATGVVVHTNLGRAPLSADAARALTEAAGYTDVEFDLATGQRARRGAGAVAALKDACPAAEDALVVNNGAAALMLAAKALTGASDGTVSPILLSRGEFIEIGAGFRLAELIESAGVRIEAVGSTNRTHAADYDRPGAILQVHRSNFTVEGFTSAPEPRELAELAHARGDVLIVDVGSGLLRPEPALPHEPDMASALKAGADIVIASGDKLLGGPQAGIVLGRAEAVARMARHPTARAVRADKLTLAGIESALQHTPPALDYLRRDADALLGRTRAFKKKLGAAGADCEIVPHDGRAGGGAGPEVPLPGWALALPEAAAEPLRTGEPAAVGQVRDGRCLIDLRCVPESDEPALAAAVERVLS